MIKNNSREEGELQAKSKEEKNEGEITTTSSRVAPSASRHWSSFRNPRIVRASRFFGSGKDRHSKVCTIRGLRDRRIRLSVPTAVELYDLQDKLGVSQPSKVIDWLLDATKQDIDKLPPLQMPLGFGDQFHQQMFGSRNLIGNLLLPQESNTSNQPAPSHSSFFPIRINDNFDGGDETHMAKSSKIWEMESGLRTKGKEILQKEGFDEKGKSIETTDLEKNAQSFFPIVGYSDNAIFNQWEPPNFYMPHQYGVQLQTENLFNPNSTPMPSSSLALPLGSQAYFCSAAVTSLFPPYPSYFTPSNENDLRPTNRFQLLNAVGSSHQQILPTSLMPGLHLMNPAMRSFQTNVDSKFLHPQGNHRREEDDNANDS